MSAIFTALEVEALEGLASLGGIERAIDDLNTNPADRYDGMTTPDHLYNISYYLGEIVETLQKIEAKMK
jgi:hypothetical protein